MKDLDGTDREIISLLQYDGRMPYTKIGKKLGISEGAVRRRVKRLMEDGVMQIVGIVEPRVMEWNAAGMIGVNVQSGHLEQAAEAIRDFPEVTYLFMASGGFDLFVEVFCKDREHFVEFLNQSLQQTPGVTRTETFMILKMYKMSYRWGQAAPQSDEVGTPS
jgi:Lrp/AsnC family transcriptional regulator for asnA, asnC and gidA